MVPMPSIAAVENVQRQVKLEGDVYFLAGVIDHLLEYLRSMLRRR